MSNYHWEEWQKKLQRLAEDGTICTVISINESGMHPSKVTSKYYASVKKEISFQEVIRDKLFKNFCTI